MEVNKEAVDQKWDTGKAPVFQGFIKYFPRAIAAVSLVSQAGSKKYANGKFPTKWREVPEGQLRYADGQARHMLEWAKGNLIDDGPGGTNCLHLAQEAWNALARLELFLKELEEADPADAYKELVNAAANKGECKPERRLIQPRRRIYKGVVFEMRDRQKSGRRKDD
jgi:Domain of unknown function (DUF5664)